MHLPVIRVVRCILITKRLDDVGQSVVLPADQNVTSPLVALDNIFDAIRIVTVTARINGKTKILRQRLYRVVRTLTCTV